MCTIPQRGTVGLMLEWTLEHDKGTKYKNKHKTAQYLLEWCFEENGGISPTPAYGV